MVADHQFSTSLFSISDGVAIYTSKKETKIMQTNKNCKRCMLYYNYN